MDPSRGCAARALYVQPGGDRLGAGVVRGQRGICPARKVAAAHEPQPGVAARELGEAVGGCDEHGRWDNSSDY